MTWPLHTLVDCLDRIIDYRGKSPRKVAHGIPLITARVIKNRRILEPTEFIAEEDYETWMRRGQPEKGDVLFTTEAPLGEVAILDRERIALAQRIVTLRPKRSLLDSKFLMFALRSTLVWKQLIKRSTGTTVRGIRQKELREVKIPLPPFSEQKRIAAILDRADEIRRKRKRAIELADQFLRSVFLDMFGDPVTNPKGWDVETVGLAAPQKGALVDGPFGSSLKPDCYVEEGVRVIRNFNILPGSFNNSEFKYVTNGKFEEIRRSEVAAEDILISTKGTVGNVCLMPNMPGPSVLSASGTVRLRITSPLWSPEFIVHHMIVPSYQRYIERNQAGAVQKYLNLTRIRGFQLIKPPVKEQTRFAEFLHRHNASRERHTQANRVADTLFRALSQRAFRGDL